MKTKDQLLARVPESVTILGMGLSAHTYLIEACTLGGRKNVTEEVWTISAIGGVVAHDRAFVMDDMKAIMEKNPDEGVNVPGMISWMKEHPGILYTSRIYPEYPGSVAYPIKEVIEHFRFPYLNNSVAYAVALAVYMGVKQIRLYGCDFTYPDRHAGETGRACVEFYLGIAHERGINVHCAMNSTMLDAFLPPERRLYGYHPGLVAVNDQAGKLVLIDHETKQPFDPFRAPLEGGEHVGAGESILRPSASLLVPSHEIQHALAPNLAAARHVTANGEAIIEAAAPLADLAKQITVEDPANAAQQHPHPQPNG